MTDTQVTGWVGWGWFAGIVLLIAGVFDAIYGFVAIIAPDSAYFLVGGGSLILFDVQGWGWWHLIAGILLILVALALFTGATWARVVAIDPRRDQRARAAVPAARAAVVVAHRAHARRARDLRAHRARAGD